MRPACTLFAGVAASHTLFSVVQSAPLKPMSWNGHDILEIVTSGRGGIRLIFLHSESLTKILCYLTAACFSGICGCLFI